MKSTFWFTVALTLLGGQGTARAGIVYDSETGAALGFTGSTPRTFMGQGFTVADPGGPVEITSMSLVLVAATAVNFAATRINVEFWDNFNSASSPVFSNPLGVNSFSTGPIITAGATAFTFILTFGSPIPLTGLTNHGIAVNWQSDAGGTGTFIDDTNLTAALRVSGSSNILPGANTSPNSGYYRNASGETDLNFQSSDARTLSGVTNGGLVFRLTAAEVAVPEPGTMLFLGSALVVLAGVRRPRARLAGRP